ncbi:isocitrate lyase/phosphoenolpyruvate mutase family protein [Dyadobacter chenwenxiniae]|uniref:Isocitrate lyase/phosphoenolpyruvate mutase family protein n=1 Tax=Dyadobacter chenwenxiniae TaxID=2906456 RepID=A0A9X1PNR5_9BACT|nr:isocitrate lyase/phosphoenolpyruvate mutase family protein [Dyadobacter chenwenxiniae]MCF0064298.1 isocitrate lyase/phosphoenolpyruvate mutase family protein [Dyadobacter chenwenxiniae]UON82490.1 isocitrate lyase/phosphoenolpyruvate mutase family protein [Dyadobacter chenwenxiniae]
MNAFEKFNQLHYQQSPLLIGNIWDVQSAKVFEAAGYAAIGTSSQAVAVANGYEDGEKLPFETLLALAKRVVEVVKIPLTVDMEGGYDRKVKGITQNIDRLHDIGVVGINLEDTVSGKSRDLLPAEEFGALLSEVTNFIAQNNLKIFVNVRTDGFLLGLPNALEETLKRIRIYEEASASGIFVPCITAKEDIKAIVNETKLPLNVMCMPNLPDFRTLGQLGVKRISIGPFLFNRIYSDAEKVADAIRSEQSFSPIFS